MEVVERGGLGCGGGRGVLRFREADPGRDGGVVKRAVEPAAERQAAGDADGTCIATSPLCLCESDSAVLVRSRRERGGVSSVGDTGRLTS